MIKNKCDRGFVMGWSTSLMTAVANIAILVLFPRFLEPSQVEDSVKALRVLSGLLE